MQRQRRGDARRFVIQERLASFQEQNMEALSTLVSKSPGQIANKVCSA